MAIIKLTKEIKKVKKTLMIEESVMKDVGVYALLLGRDPEDADTINLIFNEGMKYFFKKDKDFETFKKDKNEENNKSDFEIVGEESDQNKSE